MLNRSSFTRAFLILIFGIIPPNLYADPVFTPEKLNKYIIAGYGIAAGVDVATTQYGLGSGTVVEANPLQRYFTDKGPVVSGIAKSSMHVGIGWFLIKNREKHPRLVFASSLVLLAGQVYVDYHNAQVISAGKKTSNAIQ